jgi:hypothetical protein
VRCKNIEKWISDGIDGKLTADKRALLESHVAACASCRAYRERLENIQKESQRLLRPQPAAGYWQESISRLKAELQAREEAGTMVKAVLRPAFSPKWQWAEAGAAALLVVAFSLYFVLSGPKASLEMMAFSFGDAINGINQEIEGNPELVKDLDAVIRDSIYEQIRGFEDVVNPFHYENPLFLESLSEEELQIMELAIQNQLDL